MMARTMIKLSRSFLMLPALLWLALAIVACGSTAPAAGPSPEATLAPVVTPATQAAVPTVTPTAQAAETPPSAVTPLAVETPADVAEARVESHEDTVGTSLVSELAEEAWDRLVTLTEEHSPRASATAQELEAAEYLVREFESMGYEAGLQDFTVEVLADDPPPLSLDVPDAPEIRAHPLALSAEGQASGLLVDVGKAFQEDVPSEGLSGKIVLIERGTITFQAKVDRVTEAGAIAAVIYNNRPGRFAGRLRTQSHIPAVTISREDGQAIQQLMAQGDVPAGVSLITEVRDSRNVVAEKPGTDPNGQVIVLGGHYDTVPDVPGANDNGSGIATLLTVAREVADRSYPFTLRFIAFGSEELGLFGSRFYVSSLTSAEQADTIAMLNFDALGTADVAGILATRDLADRVVEVAKADGIPLDRQFALESGTSSDHAPFDQAGIPFVFFLASDFSRIHSPDDTLDFIQPELLGSSAALAVGLLESLSQR